MQNLQYARKKSKGRPLKYDWDAAAVHYDAGDNDQQIATKLGLRERSLVCRWRTRTGRPVQPSVRQRDDGTLAPIIRANIDKSNTVIANLANCSTGYVRAFRQREARRTA